jgi:glycosyltransferase involved in cell wall biosynthesis
MKTTATPTPRVDLIIPVHTPERPIARSVGSVLSGSDDRVRVTVVVHNTDRAAIVANLHEHASDPRLRMITHTDGIRSPAGPMNAGLDAAEADFVAVMGSDDQLEPGAISSWLARQKRAGADAVLARIRITGRGTDPYPPVRPSSGLDALDPVKDRLAYRSAPLGIVSRRRFGDLRFTEGLGSGEDLAYSATVWFTGDVIAYDLDGPAYVVNDDAGDRVTFSSRPLSEDFGFLDAIETLSWWSAADQQVKDAIVVKLLRIHVFDAIYARTNPDDPQIRERSALIGIVRRLGRISPKAMRLISRADAEALRALADATVGPHRLRELLIARQNYVSAKALIPAAPHLMLHRQAALRTLAAAAIDARRGNRR